MRRNALIRVVLIAVVVALVAGGVLYWRGLIGQPAKSANAGNPNARGETGGVQTARLTF